jgi:hypothetical protein
MDAGEMKEASFRGVKLLAVPSNPIAVIVGADECQFCYFNKVRKASGCSFGLSSDIHKAEYKCVGGGDPIVWMEPTAYVTYQLTKEPQYADRDT